MIKLIKKIKIIYKMILKELKNNAKYVLLAICFSVLSLYLISFTVPLDKANIIEYMESVRTLLLAIGAGFFGLLGFIVGGFAITSGNMAESLKTQVNKWDKSATLEYKSGDLELLIHINSMYRKILSAYQNTVKIVIFNIIAVFIFFIITLIPNEFNDIFFWLCTSVSVISFYLAIFYTLNLFSLNMKPLLIDLIENEYDIRRFLTDYKTEVESENFHPDLREIVIKNLYKKSN